MSVGEGGKTKSVCEGVVVRLDGVGMVSFEGKGMLLLLLLRVLLTLELLTLELLEWRRDKGGGAARRDCARGGGLGGAGTFAAAAVTSTLR